MREIAVTVFGRNALVAGLICHFAAVLGAMISASGGDFFFKTVYPFSCLVFAAGTYAEIKSAGSAPFTGWRWYAAAVAAVLPVIGPLIVLGLIYYIRPGRSLSGLFPAVLKLRANLLLVFILLLLFFLLFAWINIKHDPYFKRHAPKTISFFTVFVTGQKPYSKEVSCFQ